MVHDFAFTDEDETKVRRHKFYGSPSKFEINNYKKRNIKIK